MWCADDQVWWWGGWSEQRGEEEEEEQLTPKPQSIIITYYVMSCSLGGADPTNKTLQYQESDLSWKLWSTWTTQLCFLSVTVTEDKEQNNTAFLDKLPPPCTHPSVFGHLSLSLVQVFILSIMCHWGQRGWSVIFVHVCVTSPRQRKRAWNPGCASEIFWCLLQGFVHEAPADLIIYRWYSGEGGYV